MKHFRPTVAVLVVLLMTGISLSRLPTTGPSTQPTTVPTLESLAEQAEQSAQDKKQESWKIDNDLKLLEMKRNSDFEASPKYATLKAECDARLADLESARKLKGDVMNASSTYGKCRAEFEAFKRTNVRSKVEIQMQERLSLLIAEYKSLTEKGYAIRNQITDRDRPAKRIIVKGSLEIGMDKSEVMEALPGAQITARSESEETEVLEIGVIVGKSNVQYPGMPSSGGPDVDRYLCVFDKKTGKLTRFSKS